MPIKKSDLKRDDVKLDILGKQLLATFEGVERRRLQKELEWIDALRQVKGIYPPDVLKRIPEDGSKVYPKYTKSKERYIRSKINSIIFPEDGKSWSIQPTPYPEISEDILRDVEHILHSYAVEQGLESVEKIQQSVIDKVVMEIVRKRCEKMEKTMEDQLLEAGYKDVYKKVIKSGVRYGTGIWKGPMTYREPVNKVAYENGVLVQKKRYRYIPTLRFVPIWNFYPDMSTADIESVSFIFELYCMTKKDLLNLAKQPGFYRDVIYKYMNEHPTGNYTPKNWEQMLRSINESTSDVDNTDKPTVRAYQVLEYWGYIDGTYFKYAGFDDEEIEDNEVYEARVWLLGDKIIKLSLNPLPYGPHPYNVFYYEKDETSIFGTGLAEDVKGTQEVICATARMMLDNAAIVAGPQIELNTDLLVEDQDLTGVFPRKIWYRNGTGAEAQYPAVRAVNIDSHIQEYIAIIDVFRKIGDEESSLPSLLWSQLQGVETAKGVSVRYQTAHITLMDIIKEFDAANERFLRALYKWNMEFNENEDIKGDFKIVAKGTDTLLEREAIMNSIVTLMQTITEQDEPYLNRRELLRLRIKALGLDYDRVIRSDEEARAIIEQEQQLKILMAQLEQERIKAEIEYEKAKAANMLAKSKKTLTEDELSKQQFAKEILKDAERKAEKAATVLSEGATG